MNQYVPTHQVSCGFRTSNQSSGSLVETAIFSGLKKIDRIAHRQPHVADYHFMSPKDDVPEDRLKVRADVVASVGGILRLFDVRSSSKVPACIPGAMSHRGFGGQLSGKGQAPRISASIQLPGGEIYCGRGGSLRLLVHKF